MRALLVLWAAMVVASGCSQAAEEQRSPPPVQEGPSREPAPQSTPALSKEELDLADRAAWREVLQWPEECEESFTPPVEDYVGVTFYPLGPGEYLVEVVCLVAAYQFDQLYLHYRETPAPSARLLHFPLYLPDEQEEWQRQEATVLTGLPEFEPRSRELTLLTKYRGVGDCGSVARYRFENGTPHLVEFHGKAACDGRGEEWPQLVP